MVRTNLNVFPYVQKMDDINANAIGNSFTSIVDTLSLFKMQISTLQQQIRVLERNVKKEVKHAKKEAKRTKSKKVKKPSGFAMPTKVTKELCDFMDAPEGTEIARTEVTKALINYIVSNNLQGQGDKSKNKIVPDDKLKQLLGLTSPDEINDLTFFTIQKHMSKHFIHTSANNVNSTI